MTVARPPHRATMATVSCAASSYNHLPDKHDATATVARTALLSAIATAWSSSAGTALLCLQYEACSTATPTLHPFRTTARTCADKHDHKLSNSAAAASVAGPSSLRTLTSTRIHRFGSSARTPPPRPATRPTRLQAHADTAPASVPDRRATPAALRAPETGLDRWRPYAHGPEKEEKGWL